MGVNHTIAAAALGYVGDIHRFQTRDHFAAYNGTAPIEASSGNRNIHRLSRRGNRHLNHAVHMAAVVQIRNDGTTGRLYYDGKRAEGMTSKCALSALKRKISDAIYARVTADDRAARSAVGKDPGGQSGNDSASSATGSHPETPALRRSHSRVTAEPKTTTSREPPTTIAATTDRNVWSGAHDQWSWAVNPPAGHRLAPGVCGADRECTQVSSIYSRDRHSLACVRRNFIHTTEQAWRIKPMSDGNPHQRVEAGMPLEVQLLHPPPSTAPLGASRAKDNTRTPRRDSTVYVTVKLDRRNLHPHHWCRAMSRHATRRQPESPCADAVPSSGVSPGSDPKTWRRTSPTGPGHSRMGTTADI